jgi:hypothetical protein
MRLPVLGLIALGACAAGAARLIPNRIEPVVVDARVERAVTQARAMNDRGLSTAALRELGPVLAAEHPPVEAMRLRQDILRMRGRTPLLRSEAEARLAKAPDDPIALYLHARVQAPGEPQTAMFRRAAEAGPDQLWPWLGLAFAMRQTEPESALEIYERLYQASGRYPAAAIGYAQLLRAMGKSKEALAVYEQLASSGASPGVGELGIAQTAFVAGDLKKSWAALMPALRMRPYDPGVHTMVRELPRGGLIDELGEQILDTLREDPARWQDFARGNGLDVLVPTLVRAQQPFAALHELEAAKVTARQPGLRRELRRLLLTVGDVRGFLRTMREDLPTAMLADETNQVRGLWLRLLQLADGGDPLADAAKATALVESLRDCGLLFEAERCADLVLHAHPQANAVVAVRDEVRREIAFENALRRLIYRGYGDTKAPSLEQFHQQVRELAKTLLGKDAIGPLAQFSVPLVGALLDPFADGLCQHLARYNHHLTLGQRSGGIIEGLMFTRLSVRDLPADPALPLLGRCREVVGCDREVRSLSGVLGGDLAGIALLSHYVIDYDAVRDWADAIAERMRIVREDGGAVLTDPMPQQIADYEALDVHWRLTAVSSLQDSQLDAAVFDVVARHERRHLVDSFHYLPLENNLWRGLGLLFRSGFSPAAIEGEMERRAEVAALCESPHTEIVLAHIADFLAESDPSSPHVRGFGQLGRELVDTLRKQGTSPVQSRVSQWHRLDRSAVLRAAKELFGQLP